MTRALLALAFGIALGLMLGPLPPGTCLNWDGLKNRTIIAVVVRSFTEPHMELVTAAGEGHVRQSVCEDLCRQ